MNSIKFTTIITSCLLDHYRYNYLRQTIANVRGTLGDVCDEIIVVFDKVGISEITGADRCITHNGGLGKSINMGITEARNEMILQLEDDWLFNRKFNVSDSRIWENIYMILKLRRCIVRLYPDSITSVHNGGWPLGFNVRTYPAYHLEIVKPTPQDISNNGALLYYYSNNPHMKLKSFITDVGQYTENARPPQVEIDMCNKFMESDYVAMFLHGLFVINVFADNTSIRDNKLVLSQERYIRCEYMISLGNHHLPGYMLRKNQFEWNKYPYDNVFMSLDCLEYIYNNNNGDMNVLRDIANKRRSHYDIDNKFMISFPDIDIGGDVGNKAYHSMITNLDNIMNSNKSIMFIYSDYAFDNSKINDLIMRLDKLCTNMQTAYNNNNIYITLVAFENHIVNKHNIKRMSNYISLMTIYLTSPINATNWYESLDKHNETITKAINGLFQYS